MMSDEVKKKRKNKNIICNSAYDLGKYNFFEVDKNFDNP